MAELKLVPKKPTGAFIGVSWLVLVFGVGVYLVSLWNANMDWSDKRHYIGLLVFGLFAVVSVQKTVRDRDEDVPVTNIYYGIAWFAVLADLLLLIIELWNSGMPLVEKGLYISTFVFSLFAVITVQKNVRDVAVFAEIEKNEMPQRKSSQMQEAPRQPVNPPSRPQI